MAKGYRAQRVVDTSWNAAIIHPVQTRYLILAALVTGMAILVAGALWFSQI